MSVITQSKVRIKTDEKPITFTQIELGKFSQQKAEHIKRGIESKSGFMNFEVLCCPCMGEWNVIVQTSYKANKEKILGQLFYLMATLI